MDVRNPPPPCGGAAFVQFDSHRAISFGGRVGENLSNAFFILDLSTKVYAKNLLLSSVYMRCSPLIDETSPT